MIKFKNKILGFLLAFILLISSTINAYAYTTETNTNIDVINEVKSKLQGNYYTKVSDAVLQSTTLDDLFKALNDPYSAYFTSQEYDDFLGTVNSSFTGIGISVEVVAQGVKVTTVYDKTPAKTVGIKIGDIITGADGHALAGATTEEAVSYIKGEAGTSVSLVILRGTSTLNFTVTREQISLPTVIYKVLSNHIGYVQINVFGDKTTSEFKAAIDSLKKKKVDSYVIDLRSNPGGYLETALEIAGFFIGDKTAMQVKSNDSDNFDLYAYKQPYVIDKPVTFLTNEYSASASEVLSAAVKDYKKAFFIGKKTYGKGVAQQIMELSNNDWLKLTVFEFLSPKGKTINHVGVSPDLKVDETLASQDPVKVAQVLYSGALQKNKAKLIKLVLNGTTFYIDTNVFTNKDLKTVANYVKTKVMTKSNSYIYKR